MKTFINCNPTRQQEQAYDALHAAAERIGKNNFKSQYAQHIKKGRSPKTFKFSVTAEHSLVIEYMSKVLNGEVSAEECYSLLWNYDVMNQRLAQ